MSDVPHGLTLGPQLCAIYLKRLEEGNKDMNANFSDDTNINRKGNCEGECKVIKINKKECTSFCQKYHHEEKFEIFFFGRKFSFLICLCGELFQSSEIWR